MVDLEAAGSRNLLLIPIGVPGVGKTTLATYLVRAHIISADSVISTDAIRDAAPDLDEPSVFRHAHDLLRQSLKHHGITYFDACNVQQEKREQLLKIAHGCNARVLFIIMPRRVADVSGNQRTRKKDIPPELLKSLSNVFLALDVDSLSAPVISSETVFKEPEIVLRL